MGQRIAGKQIRSILIIEDPAGPQKAKIVKKIHSGPYMKTWLLIYLPCTY